MAYTKTEWVNDSVPAINATNLNKIEQGIKDIDTEVTNNCVKKIRYDGQNIDGFKDWVINTAPNGSYLVTIGLNGSVSCAIVQKANVNYLSFIHFSYGITAKQYRYNQGTWYEVQL